MTKNKWLGLGLGVVILSGVGWGVWWWWPMRDPGGKVKVIEEKSLTKYDFNELRKRQASEGEIKIIGDAGDIGVRRTKKVDYESKIIIFESKGKKISGVMNYHPEKSATSPVVIMIRGYAEKAGYYPGSGSWRVADELAAEGYVTVSTDFLGYGMSEAESEDILEARFEKVVTVVDLIESVKKLPFVDPNRIGIWAHSNGGQIALSVLEVTGENYPTVLWAPMTQPFPESVLSTIDAGSPVEGVMTDFMKKYDARRYAFENYYQWLAAPILIQQGTKDEWCQVEWQEGLQGRLRELGKQVELVVYEGANHNLTSKWEEAVEKDGEWYGEHM